MEDKQDEEWLNLDDEIPNSKECIKEMWMAIERHFSTYNVEKNSNTLTGITMGFFVNIDRLLTDGSSPEDVQEYRDTVDKMIRLHREMNDIENRYGNPTHIGPGTLN